MFFKVHTVYFLRLNIHIESNITQDNKLNSTTISFQSGKKFFDDLSYSLRTWLSTTQKG